MAVFDYKCRECGAVREIYLAPCPEVPGSMELPCQLVAGTGAACQHDRQVSAPHVVIPSKHRAAG